MNDSKPSTAKTGSLEGYIRHINNFCKPRPTLLSLGEELVNEPFLARKRINDAHILYLTEIKKRLTR
jgi:hypothetical protein